MSDPQKFTRDYSFTDYQASNPSAPLPGLQVDAELEDVEASIGGIVDAIKDVRRSDGALKNGIVTTDSLSPTVAAGVGAGALASAAAAAASADAASDSAVAAAASATAAAGSATSASGYAGNALTSRNEAETERTLAQTARTGAQTARDFSNKWATEAGGVLVDDGVNDPDYSAYHYAQVALGAAAGALPDNSVSTAKIVDAAVTRAKLATAVTNELDSLAAGISAKADTASVDGKVVYAAKSGSYTAVGADNNAVLRFTASATVSLTAAATLGANWHLSVVADGGAVAIDPNGSETINGQTTLIVPNGATAEIICDGSNFFAILKPALWEPIGQGLYPLSAVSQLVITDLDAYRKIRISGQLVHSVTSSLLIAVSTNNGSSFDTGTNYQYQTMNASGPETSATGSTNQVSLVIAGVGGLNASIAYPFSCELQEFNQASICGAISEDGAAQNSARVIRKTSTFHNVAAARNAFRIYPSGGTFTGQITVEGVRG